jgi:hypothetical protein
MPSDAGFLLTGIADDNGNNNGRHILVRINGVDAWRCHYDPAWGMHITHLSPGIVLYPGSTVEVSSSSSYVISRLSITGYLLTLADLGM